MRLYFGQHKETNFMALIKDIELPSGHTCSYWKIISIEKNFHSDTSVIKVAGFKDAEARDSGKPFIADSVKVYYGYPDHGGTDAAYTWLKDRTTVVSQSGLPNPDYDPEVLGSLMFTEQPPLVLHGEFHEAIDS